MMVNKHQKNHDLIKRPPYDTVDIKALCGNEQINIRGPLSPDTLNRLKPAENLNCFRPAQKQHDALVSLSRQPDGLVFAACSGDTMVSYITFQKPDFPWWKHHSLPELIELGAMETDSRRRRAGLVTYLLKSLFENPRFPYFEQYVVITIQTVCNWDLSGTGLSAWDYRRLMVSFFKKYGFLLWQTADPEICEDPCSILLARIGKNTPDGTENRFQCCCMGDKQSHSAPD